jgi:hypothetical protein
MNGFDDFDADFQCEDFYGPADAELEEEVGGEDYWLESHYEAQWELDSY